VEKFISNLKIGKKKTLAEVKDELQNGGQKKATGEALGKELKEFKELLPKDVSRKDLLFWGSLILAGLAIIWVFAKTPADTRWKVLSVTIAVAVLLAGAAFVLFTFWAFVDNTVHGDNVVYNTVIEPPPAQRDQFGPERLIDFGTGEISQNELVIMTFDQEVKKVKVTRTILVASLEQGRSPAIDCGQGALIFVPGTKEPKNRFLPGRLSGRSGGVFLPAGTEIVFGSGQKEIKGVFRDRRPGKLFTQHTVGCREVR
jgi:hypothetical protein